MAASSSCLATVLGCDNRENAGGKTGVGQGVRTSGGRLAGDEGVGGTSDILRPCCVDELDASQEDRVDPRRAQLR